MQTIQLALSKLFYKWLAYTISKNICTNGKQTNDTAINGIWAFLAMELLLKSNAIIANDKAGVSQLSN